MEIKSGIIEFLLKDQLNIDMIFLAMKIQFENQKKPNVYFKLSDIKNSSEYLNNSEKLKNDFHNNLKALENEILNSEKFEIKI